MLKYEVSTIEYPYYVLASRYNDTWRLAVLASSGTQLFSISRAINSQLYAPPTWNSGGSTGELQKEIDVTALAANGDIQLTLAATTTNVGDELLPTTVVATLGTDETITIDAIDRDTVNPTTGQSNRFSIPAAGQMNTFQRRFDVTFSKPEDVHITNVKAELMGSDGGMLSSRRRQGAGLSARADAQRSHSARRGDLEQRRVRVASTPRRPTRFAIASR